MQQSHRFYAQNLGRVLVLPIELKSCARIAHSFMKSH